MATYEIKKEDAGEYICEGFKAINYDCSTKGAVDFRYGKEGESFIGKVFTVDGNLEECKNGLHFCKKPSDIFHYYEPLGYNRYFKIKAYGEVVDAKTKDKSVARTIEFVEEYDFMEFTEKLKGNNYSHGNNHSFGNNHSHGNNYSDGNNYSHGNNHSHGNNCSFGNNCSDGNNYSDGNNHSHGNNCSDGNNHSFGNNHSHGNNYSFGNNCSDGNNYSDGNNHSHGNNCSDGNNHSHGNNHSDGNNHSFGNNHSHGNNCSDGTSECYGLKKCKGAYRSIFCLDKVGIAYCVFNKQSSEERIAEIMDKLNEWKYYPKWTNIEELHGTKEWWAVCWPKFAETIDTAWDDMPEEMIEYIKSLPEYDEEIFNLITEN